MGRRHCPYIPNDLRSKCRPPLALEFRTHVPPPTFHVLISLQEPLMFPFTDVTSIEPSELTICRSVILGHTHFGSEPARADTDYNVRLRVRCECHLIAVLVRVDVQTPGRALSEPFVGHAKFDLRG